MSQTKIKIGVMGAAGYTGGELLRLLIHHPNAELVFAHSRSKPGIKLYEVHTDLLGDTSLEFTNNISQDVDVVFLCVGHGKAKLLMAENLFDSRIRIIDLSQDFRLTDASHNVVYGLPELNREQITKAHYVANPGCFATAIQLALLPLAKKGNLHSDIHISATTGATGAGQSLSDTSHYSWRHNNMSVYKAFSHQHLSEIKQSLAQLQQGFKTPVHFIPQRGAFTRGIIAAVYTTYDDDADAAKQAYQTYYENHPFVHISQQAVDVKQVVNTNKCLLYLEKNEDQLMVVSVIDNLLKGASGQALQNMNLMFGLAENTGLNLKATAF